MDVFAGGKVDQVVSITENVNLDLKPVVAISSNSEEWLDNQYDEGHQSTCRKMLSHAHSSFQLENTSIVQGEQKQMSSSDGLLRYLNSSRSRRSLSHSPTRKWKRLLTPLKGDVQQQEKQKLERLVTPLAPSFQNKGQGIPGPLEKAPSNNWKKRLLSPMASETHLQAKQKLERLVTPLAPSFQNNNLHSKSFTHGSNPSHMFKRLLTPLKKDVKQQQHQKLARLVTPLHPPSFRKKDTLTPTNVLPSDNAPQKNPFDPSVFSSNHPRSFPRANFDHTSHPARSRSFHSSGVDIMVLSSPTENRNTSSRGTEHTDNLFDNSGELLDYAVESGAPTPIHFYEMTPFGERITFENDSGVSSGGETPTKVNDDSTQKGADKDMLDSECSYDLDSGAMTPIEIDDIGGLVGTIRFSDASDISSGAMTPINVDDLHNFKSPIFSGSSGVSSGAETPSIVPDGSILSDDDRNSIVSDFSLASGADTPTTLASRKRFGWSLDSDAGSNLASAAETPTTIATRKRFGWDMDSEPGSKLSSGAATPTDSNINAGDSEYDSDSSGAATPTHSNINADDSEYDSDASGALTPLAISEYDSSDEEFEFGKSTSTRVVPISPTKHKKQPTTKGPAKPEGPRKVSFRHSNISLRMAPRSPNSTHSGIIRVAPSPDSRCGENPEIPAAPLKKTPSIWKKVFSSKKPGSMSDDEVDVRTLALLDQIASHLKGEIMVGKHIWSPAARPPKYNEVRKNVLKTIELERTVAHLIENGDIVKANALVFRHIHRDTLTVIEARAVQWAVAEYAHHLGYDDLMPVEHGYRYSYKQVLIRHTIGWMLICLYCIAHAYWIFAFAVLQGEDTAKAWLQSFFIGFLEDLLLLVPLKLLVLIYLLPLAAPQKIHPERFKKLPQHSTSVQISAQYPNLDSSKLILQRKQVQSDNVPEGYWKAFGWHEVPNTLKYRLVWMKRGLLKLLLLFIIVSPSFIQELLAEGSSLFGFNMTLLWMIDLYSALRTILTFDELILAVLGVCGGILIGCFYRSKRR